MKKFLGELALLLGALYFGAAGLLAPLLFINYVSYKNWNEELIEQSKHYRYYFEGANNRGLLDICIKEGKRDIYFKDECSGS